MTEQWQELKETITEMRDNGGTGTQQEVCKFLANYMEILEKQMQQSYEDCISREQAIKQCGFGMTSLLIANRLRKLPSVTPKYTDEEIDRAQAVEQAYVDKMVELAVEETKRPTARWERLVEDYDKCSKCGEMGKLYRIYKYCPNCGSEMTESEGKDGNTM